MLSDSQDLRRHLTHSWDSENISWLLCPLSDLADSEWQTLQPAPEWICFFLVLTQHLTHPSIACKPLPSAVFNFLGLTSAHTFHEAWAPPAPSSSLLLLVGPSPVSQLDKTLKITLPPGSLAFPSLHFSLICVLRARWEMDSSLRFPRTYCRAQGNVTWQLGWEEILEENGYLDMYDWAPLPFS